MSSPKVKLANLPTTKDQIVIWWYGPVLLNSAHKDNPSIKVFYREFVQAEKLGDIKSFTTTISQLMALPIGSIWKHQKKISTNKYKKKTYKINVDPSTFRITSLQQEPSLIQPSDYELLYTTDRNKLLLFSTQDQNLLIPCMEFYASMYGRSAEVKRTLLSYPWKDLITNFFKGLEPDENGNWRVEIGGRLVNDDAVFIGHLWNDTITQNAVKKLNNQLAAAASNHWSDYCFLEVYPWFHGPLEIEVEGIELLNNNFLALRITGCNEPVGNPIVVMNQTSSTTSNHSTGISDGLNMKVWSSKRKMATDGIKIDDGTNPDQGTSPVRVDCRSIKLIGIKRKLVAGKTQTQGTRPSAFALTQNKSNLSTNTPHARGKGVGNAALVQPAEIDTSDGLFSVWKAYLDLKTKIPSRLTDLAWWTDHDGFKSHDTPKLASFRAPNNKQTTKPTKSIIRWRFLDDSRIRPRGLLIIRLKIDSEIFFVLEIQRKKNLDCMSSKEAFRGCIFKNEGEEDSLKFIESLLGEIPLQRGVFERSIENIEPRPVEYALYNHNFSSKKGAHSMEKTIKNALRKVGIVV